MEPEDNGTVKILTADEIWAAKDIEERIVPVPQWGGAVRIRTLSQKQSAELRRRATRVNPTTKQSEMDNEALERLIGQSSDWARLDEFLISFVVEPSLAPTVFASSFASTLELVREGRMEINQQTAFAPIYVRKRQRAPEGTAEPGVAAPAGGMS